MRSFKLITLKYFSCLSSIDKAKGFDDMPVVFEAAWVLATGVQLHQIVSLFSRVALAWRLHVTVSVLGSIKKERDPRACLYKNVLINARFSVPK